MRKNTTTMMALVATLALIGIGSMPVQAVPADCDEDYDIPTSPPSPDTLAGQNSETGRAVVSGNDQVKVTVELSSDDSILDFGVFMENDFGLCVAAADESPSMATCEDDEQLDTHDDDHPLRKACILEPPSGGSGSQEYFFHFENDQGDPLEYRAWAETI